jgi:hypothetical protein
MNTIYSGGIRTLTFAGLSSEIGTRMNTIYSAAGFPLETRALTSRQGILRALRSAHQREVRHAISLRLAISLAGQAITVAGAS